MGGYDPVSLNVRAYTKDSSSKVKNPGTFDALREKIPYLKKLGATSLLLQPAYDFNEVTEQGQGMRLNLWGYVPGNYFVPKPSYASGDPDSRSLQPLWMSFTETRWSLSCSFISCRMMLLHLSWRFSDTG